MTPEQEQQASTIDWDALLSRHHVPTWTWRDSLVCWWYDHPYFWLRRLPFWRFKVWSAIRRNPDDGNIDDVAITSDIFRLEQMDDTTWWAQARRGGRFATFWLFWDATSQRIVCQCLEDTIGCTDDTHDA